MKKIISIGILINIGTAYGIELNQRKIEGSVISYDERKICIKTSTRKVCVLRNLNTNNFLNIKGQISSYVQADDVMKENQ